MEDDVVYSQDSNLIHMGDVCNDSVVDRYRHGSRAGTQTSGDVYSSDSMLHHAGRALLSHDDVD